jgi:membrane protein implicated in regulation of membrane protease activity
MTPRWRPTVGVFLIIAIIIIWAVLIASLAEFVTTWPWPVQAIFYTAAGIVWVFPMRPILRWSETGRWRSDRGRT